MLDFEKMGGLVPCIVQEEHTKDVLMLAFLNRQAWEESQRTGYAHYYSRSRKSLWKKGETSGHLQKIKEIRIDCDNDTVLFIVEQIGGSACHTGRHSCFFRRIENKKLVDTGE